jgi:hypothetical protein
VTLALARGKHWSALKGINLSVRGELTSEAVGALSANSHLRELEDLLLPGASLRPDAVESVAAGLPELRTLSLHGRSLENAAAEAVARSKTLSHLRRLSAREQAAFTDPAILLGLLTSPTLAELASLELEGTCKRWDQRARRFRDAHPRAPVSDLASVRLGRKCRPPTLRELRLVEFGLGPAEAELFARLPSLRGLESLDLRENPLRSEGAAALASGAWERLTWLTLSSCLIDARGAEALAAAPCLARLTQLDLSNNPLGPEGARAIARSPHLRGLCHLSLRGAGVDAGALAELKGRFGRKGWSGETFIRPAEETR